MSHARALGSALLLSALLLVGIAAIAPGRARASSLTLNLTTDPSLGTIHNVADASLNLGKQWTSEVIAFPPIALNQGDDVTVNVSFSGGFALALQSGAFFSGNEEFVFILQPDAPDTTIQQSSTLTSLTGVVGNLDALLPVDAMGADAGKISGGLLAVDLTNTSFQFDGFEIHTTYTSLTGGPVMLSEVQLIAAANNVAVVPEPSANLLLAATLITLARLRARG
jgi:hypothetical protein